MVVLIFVVTEDLVRIIIEYVWFFRVINFTQRCNRKGRILTSVTNNLSGL